MWEQIEDFEEVARGKGLKADFDAIAMMDLSAELPPPRDNQVILLASLAFIFLGFTILLFLSIGNYSADDSLQVTLPCCCSSILVIIFAAWGQTIQDEDKKLRDSVFAKKMLEIKEQREAVEGEELREQRREQRARRRKAMRREASEREMALDYDSAIRIWEELGQIKEAARVRKLKAEQSVVKVDQTVVHGDYVDDRDTTYIDDRDTIVKDSVVNRSSIGAGGDDKLGKIKELKKLHDSGAIDDDDYEKMKREIIG